MPPKISVIIPCFNQAEFLDDCVNSVLGQTTHDFEIIVVDDGSTAEASKKILDNFSREKTTLIRQKNMGLPGARNTGIKHAKGKYILPLDCDDKISSDVLKKCSEYLDLHGECGICGGLTEFFGDKTGIWNLPKYSYPEILKANCLVCTNMFRKCDWNKIGGYNPNMKYGLEDWDFWLSIIELGRTVFQFDKVFLYYRKHGRTLISNVSGNNKRHKQMIKQIIKNHRKTYDRFPEIVKSIKRDLSPWFGIKKFLIRILCFFIPSRDLRHKSRV